MENTKKLQRDTQNRVLGGVCSGLANYFEIDPALTRVLFAIAFLAFSVGFWIYIILWIVMPATKYETTAQQLVENADGQETPEKKETKSNKSALSAGLILIITGSCFLLGNLVPKFTWRTFWPVALILLGLFLIFPFKDNKS